MLWCDTRLLGLFFVRRLLLKLPRFIPAGIGVVGFHGFSGRVGFLAEVLLVHHSVFADHERHHAGIAVLSGIGHEREAAGHFSGNNVVGRATGSTLSLTSDDAEVIAVKWRRGSMQILWRAVRNAGVRDQLTDGALRLFIGAGPVQAVLLSRVTGKFLRVFVVLFREVFILRGHELLANANSRQVVLADPPVQNFLLSCISVEVPRSAFVHQRYGRGPIFRSDIERGGAVRLFQQPVHLLISLDEIRASFLVRGRVSRRNDFLRVRAQNLQQGFFVATLKRRHQRIGGRLWGRECFLSRLLRRGACGKTRQQNEGERSYY